MRVASSEVVSVGVVCAVGVTSGETDGARLHAVSDATSESPVARVRRLRGSGTDRGWLYGDMAVLRVRRASVAREVQEVVGLATVRDGRDVAGPARAHASDDVGLVVRDLVERAEALAATDRGVHGLARPGAQRPGRGRGVTDLDDVLVAGARVCDPDGADERHGGLLFVGVVRRSVVSPRRPGGRGRSRGGRTTSR